MTLGPEGAVERMLTTCQLRNYFTCLLNYIKHYLPRW
jgi:hypothetical protein